MYTTVHGFSRACQFRLTSLREKFAPQRLVPTGLIRLSEALEIRANCNDSGIKKE